METAASAAVVVVLLLLPLPLRLLLPLYVEGHTSMLSVDHDGLLTFSTTMQQLTSTTVCITVLDTNYCSGRSKKQRPGPTNRLDPVWKVPPSSEDIN